VTAKSVVVFDYGTGNIHSAIKALELAGATVELTKDPATCAEADGLVVPGVGAFAAVMQALLASGGDGIIGRRLAGGRPVLGICVGMQVMFDHGVEGGVDTPGLAQWPGVVRKLDSDVLPHMGWNTLHMVKPHPLTAGFNEQTHLYFVHSFALEGETTSLADCVYSRRFPAIISHNNIAGIQAHPEKSSTAGLTFLKNFLSWRP
jgi:glutamine amidotransferase